MFRTARRVFFALALFSIACGDPPPGAAGYVRLSNHVEDWRDEVIYQLMVDRFADGDPNNNWNVDRTALGKYQGGDWQGVIGGLSVRRVRDVAADAALPACSRVWPFTAGSIFMAPAVDAGTGGGCG